MPACFNMLLTRSKYRPAQTISGKDVDRCTIAIYKFTLADPNVTQLAQLGYVLVQATDQGYTFYTGVRADVSGEQLQAIKANIANLSRVWLVDWVDFRSNPGKYLHAYVLRNDYPQDDLADGVAAMLQRLPGMPFGVTWNGGIAITSGDYAHSRRTLAAYAANPDSFHPPERAADPVHPLNHFGALLRSQTPTQR